MYHCSVEDENGFSTNKKFRSFQEAKDWLDSVDGWGEMYLRHGDTSHPICLDTGNPVKFWETVDGISYPVYLDDLEVY